MFRPVIVADSPVTVDLLVNSLQGDDPPQANVELPQVAFAIPQHVYALTTVSPCLLDCSEPDCHRTVNDRAKGPGSYDPGPYRRKEMKRGVVVRTTPMYMIPLNGAFAKLRVPNYLRCLSRAGGHLL